jgi:hypothetical protein
MRLGEKTQDRRLRLTILITAARVRGRRNSAELAAAEAILRQTVAETWRNGYFLLYLESRLRLAEIEMQAGETAAAHRDLDSLVNEAGSKGYRLVANRANDLRSRARLNAAKASPM